MGCLVLMTIVVVAVVMNNRKPSKKLTRPFMPTMMAVPTHDLASMNPLSARTLYPPQQTRGLTTITD
jgi:hypothetical protein